MGRRAAARDLAMATPEWEEAASARELVAVRGRGRRDAYSAHLRAAGDAVRVVVASLAPGLCQEEKRGKGLPKKGLRNDNGERCL